MKEAIFVLVVIAALIALTAFRYRRQIKTVIGVWRMLRSAKNGRAANQMDEAKETAAGPLVNCAKCGTWVPKSTAMRVPPKLFYCSRACLERSVEHA